jgi:hypothetical protein
LIVATDDESGPREDVGAPPQRRRPRTYVDERAGPVLGEGEGEAAAEVARDVAGRQTIGERRLAEGVEVAPLAEPPGGRAVEAVPRAQAALNEELEDARGPALGRELEVRVFFRPGPPSGSGAARRGEERPAGEAGEAGEEASTGDHGRPPRASRGGWRRAPGGEPR